VDLRDFFDNVESDSKLRGLEMKPGKSPEEDLLTVEHLPSGNKTSFLVPTILESSWNVLRELITGELPVNPLYHVSRIVGYFSRIENWNKSKIGEIKDRRKGSYSFDEALRATG
jgi:hypothetical protein